MPSVWPMTSDFGAEIGDIDLSQPLTDDAAAVIDDAFSKYSVLIFPDQHISQQQHVEFAGHFGPLEQSIARHREGREMRVRLDLADVSNLNPDDTIQAKEDRLRIFRTGNRLWHRDSSFKFIPARASLLYARSIPPVGGHTEFADMRAAYDDLHDLLKEELEDLVAEHCIRYSRARMMFDDFSENEIKSMPPVPQKIIWTSEKTNRKNLYLASHAGKIIGMEEGPGRELIDRLIDHATQRQYVFIHRWRQNDLVIWDNRCTMHRGTAYEDMRYPRDIQRATVSDEINSCERAGLVVENRETAAMSS
ncbi:MAG: TauD/TfdA family dioxygenase [Sneathiella sp.]|nr:TauD/TfdA family dioxygenase [Sneathiella sp.]